MQTTKHKILFLSLLGLLAFASCKTKSVASQKSNISDSENQLKAKSLFYNACREKIKGNAEIAGNLFRECIKLDPNNHAAKYELGNLYRFAGLYEMALKFAQEAATQKPDNEWYQLLLIECLHNRRLYNEACVAYEKLIKNYPDRYEFHQDLAAEYVFASKPEKALQSYDNITKKFGVIPENSLSKVRLLKEQKKWQDAETEMKLLIKSFPNESEFYTMLAELYQETNQFEKALSTYKEILTQDPENPYVHLALADYYRQMKMDQEFQKEIKIAFASHALDIDNKIKILVSYFSMTEQYPQYLSQAYDLCEVLVATHPNEPKAHSIYGDFLFRDRRLKEAQAAFTKVIEYDKNKFAIWNQLLICDTELDQYDVLLKHSAECAELFPTQPAPYYFLALANLHLKNYKAAAEALANGKEFVLDTDPLIIRFLSVGGEVFQAMGEFEKSDKEFEEALRLDPNNDLLMNNYAYYLSLRKSKLDRAEKLIQRALEINNSNVSFMDTYGNILFQQERFNEAKTWLEKALKNGGDNRPAILEHYGDVLYKTGETTKSVEWWKRSKEAGNKSEILEKKIKEGKWIEQK